MSSAGDFHQKLRDLIKEKFEFYRQRNARLSMRSFARTLGVSPSALSEYMSGKRHFTQPVARKILSNLGTNELNDFEMMNLGAKVLRPISKEEVFLVKDWVYFAILSLAETSDFRPDPDWIGKRLNIETNRAQKVLEELVKLNLLMKLEGTLVPTNAELISSDEVENSHLWHRYASDFDLAKQSLKQDKLAIRDFTFMTLSIDPADIKKYKRCIRKLQDEICKIQEKGEKKEVYEFCFQVFPLSRRPSEDEI